MRLFTIGPVQMSTDIVTKFRGGEQVPYFRTPEFSQLMLETDHLMKRLVHTAESSRTIYLTASGTAAMEATVMNCFTPSDRLLVINGGTFGQRFVDICNIHHIPYDVIRLPYGETLGEQHLLSFADRDYTALLVNIDETSTGQLYDIDLLHKFCQAHDMYLVVDAISSFLCDPYDMDRFGIDVTISSTQKGACVEPGMAMVVLSNRMVQERVLRQSVRSLYFDFKLYLDNFQRGQTPFTPAVGICQELHASLQCIDEIGLEKHLAHIATVAHDFRTKVQALPVSLPGFPLSNAITPILFDEPIAYRVFEVLKDCYEIMVNPTGGPLHDKSLRIAHIGETDCQNNDMLIEKMQQAIADVKAGR